MDTLTLTVFFEEPFWVGVFERVSAGKLSVRKVTFGAEPKDYEVYDFILKRYDTLKFSETVEIRRTPRNADSVTQKNNCAMWESEQKPNRRFDNSGKRPKLSGDGLRKKNVTPKNAASAH